LNMQRYVLRRTAETILTFFVVLTLNFYLFRIMPGDPIRLMFRGARLSQADMVKLSAQFGLSDPLWLQYFIYLRNTFEGNFGISFYFGEPVVKVLAPRIINTVILLIPATILSVAFGVLLGILSAYRRGKLSDVASVLCSFALYAMPVFWISILFVIMAVSIGGLPISGMVTEGTIYPDAASYLFDVGRHLLLPTLTLALGLLGQFVLVMRNSMLDVLEEDYMVTAVAKGVRGKRLYWNHAARNALLPTVTLIALNFGFVFGGAVQTETVFTWPGLGLLTYNALITRDYPVLQGCFLVFSIAVILSNFLADVVYAYLDPRVRYGK
jgi:peptide/nickel transport system permease protein